MKKCVKLLLAVLALLAVGVAAWHFCPCCKKSEGECECKCKCCAKAKALLAKLCPCKG